MSFTKIIKPSVTKNQTMCAFTAFLFGRVREVERSESLPCYFLLSSAHLVPLTGAIVSQLPFHKNA